MIRCAFCHLEVTADQRRTAWRKVTVWVHGAKANGAAMQGTETLAWAHDGCARLERRGVSAKQGNLL